jgi:hypothetical protein
LPAILAEQVPDHQLLARAGLVLERPQPCDLQAWHSENIIETFIRLALEGLHLSAIAPTECKAIQFRPAHASHLGVQWARGRITDACVRLCIYRYMRVVTSVADWAIEMAETISPSSIQDSSLRIGPFRDRLRPLGVPEEDQLQQQATVIAIVGRTGVSSEAT